MATNTYRVRRKDNPSRLAARYDSEVARLLRMNPALMNRVRAGLSVLRPGMALRVPSNRSGSGRKDRGGTRSGTQPSGKAGKGKGPGNLPKPRPASLKVKQGRQTARPQPRPQIQPLRPPPGVPLVQYTGQPQYRAPLGAGGIGPGVYAGRTRSATPLVQFTGQPRYVTQQPSGGRFMGPGGVGASGGRSIRSQGPGGVGSVQAGAPEPSIYNMLVRAEQQNQLNYGAARQGLPPPGLPTRPQPTPTVTLPSQYLSGERDRTTVPSFPPQETYISPPQWMLELADADNVYEMLGRGERPPILTPYVIARLGLTEQELKDAGYVLGDYGAWYMLGEQPQEVYDQAYQDPSGYSGYGGYGGGGYGGGGYGGYGGSPLYEQRRYANEMGLVTWRIK